MEIARDLVETYPDYLDYLRLNGTLQAKLGHTGVSRRSFKDALSFLDGRSSQLSPDLLAKIYQQIGNATFDVKFLGLSLRACTGSLNLRDDSTIRVKAAGFKRHTRRSRLRQWG